jgi:outer membrane receptor protein involved in Fe transport
MKAIKVYEVHHSFPVFPQCKVCNKFSLFEGDQPTMRPSPYAVCMLSEINAKFTTGFNLNQNCMTRFLRFFGAVALLLFVHRAGAQTARIGGVVSDKVTGEKLPGVSVIVKGTSSGASTDMNGRFSLTVSATFPLQLRVSYVGYQTAEQEVVADGEIRIALEKVPVLGQEIVISASRTPERILESPVSIERMGAAAVGETAAPSFYDAITNFKGVESSVQSLTFRSLSTRGFNTNGNIRFNQFMDGMDNQAPGLNFSVGNVVGAPDIDIESVELLPGAASALYGAGGTNGTLLMTSKDPFTWQGLSVSIKGGLNHTDERQHSRAGYSDIALRYAASLGSRVAFKATASRMQGQDWQAENYLNFDRYNGVVKAGNRTTDPLYDGVNIYGDEPNASYPTLLGVARAVQTQTQAGILAASGGTLDIVAQLDQLPANATSVQINDLITGLNLPSSLAEPVQNLIPFYFGLRNNVFPNQPVTRTGYEEKYLVDYGAESFKISGAVHYKLNNRITAIAQANLGKGTSVYTGSDRYSLGGFDIGQYKLELKSDAFFIRGYTTQERSGDAYNATLLGTYINETSTPSSQWFPMYAATYATAKNAGMNDQEAHAAARAFADQNRAQPGTPGFETIKNDIISRTIGPAGGAKFNDKSNLYHLEGMYDLSKALNGALDVQVGSSYRTFNLHSDGTIFDDLNRNISINEFGAFAQAGKRLFGGKFKLTGALRYDKNENFDGRFTPRISGVYSAGRNNHIRVSYQAGYRNPTTQNQYIDLLVGGSSGIRMIGGLPELISKYGLNTTKGYTLASVNRFKQTGNPSDLQQYTFGKFKPESVKAYEIGYKGLFNKAFLFDISYYYNAYRDFISALVLLQPTVPASPADPLGSPRTFTSEVNNHGKVSAQGILLGGDYLLGNYMFNGNFAYNKQNGHSTMMSSEFNTPRFKVNLGALGKQLYKNLGFAVNYRWQGGYDWSSTFAAGRVDAFGTVDAQVNYTFKNSRTVLKAGGANIFNTYYVTSFGNPAVGGLYYLSLTFDPLMR